MNRKILATLGAASALAISSPAAAQGCSRELLDEITAGWVSAIETGRMTEMKLGEWVDYFQNFRRASLGAFLDNPRKVDWHMAVKDTTICRVAVQAVLLDEENPMVIATQIGNGFFGVGPFQNITSSTNDWLFDAAATLRYASAEDWSEIPEAERHSRQELIAAADAYLDLFSDPAVEVPWGEPCARLEGGAYTGRGLPTDSCNVGVPEDIAMTDRVYAVDPTIGAVNVLLKMGPQQRPDSHTFRVENGKLRYIHTVTNCGSDVNCGFRPFAEMLAENPDLQPDL